MSSSQQGIRLNKYLASCGIGSRRSCDTIIQEGRVFINNACCTNMGTRVMSDDLVRVGRKMVKPRLEEVVLFNKPRGLVCSSSDELGRETIYNVLPPKYQHLKNVGRLDMNSEGIIVLTNDGELAQKLTHPRQKIEKEYVVTLDQSFSNEVLEKFLTGVHTPEGRLTAKAVKRVSSRRVKIVLVTGVKRQIRVMFEAIHLKVTKLVRIRIGMLTGGGLEIGDCMLLEEDDIKALQINPNGRQVIHDPTLQPDDRVESPRAQRGRRRSSSHQSAGKMSLRRSSPPRDQKKKN